MLEIRWHGRGGQGAFTACRLLALAGTMAGFYSQAFPTFGPERRGAPIMAFTRLARQPVRIRCQVTHPLAVAVLDPSLVNEEAALGMGGEGFLAANNGGGRLRVVAARQCTLDAYQVARETVGNTLVNTVLLGYVVALGIDKIGLAQLEAAVAATFPEKTAGVNVAALRRGYEMGKSEVTHHDLSGHL